MEVIGNDGAGDLSDELLAGFIQELTSALVALEKQVIDLESGNGGQEAIDATFRAFHNIKGSASLMGLTTLTDLMHYSESLLNHYREKGGTVDEDTISIILDVIAKMKVITENLKESGKEGEERHFDTLLALVNQLNAIKNAGQGSEEKKTKEQKGAKKESDKGGDEGDELIKVSKSLLEQIMLTVGNFMTVENRFQYLCRRYPDDFDLSENATLLGDQLQKLQQVALRMQLSSVSTMFNSMHRVVRGVTKATKKKISFETRGNDTLMDRKILDQLNDPLIHMVRNACDHGIETPEIRLKMNKPEEGQVVLSAFQKGGEVFVQLQDDGAGMDPEKLKAKAIEKGIITTDEAQQMLPSEAFQLIFRAGFSSAEVVTDISGRGVGMDVVRSAIENIGGQIEIESTVGVGTTFILRLPLSLSIVECLEFVVSGQKYAVQQVNVEEVFSGESQTVREGRVALNSGTEVVNVRDVPVPILPLQKLFGGESDKVYESEQFILVKHGESRFCLSVDNIVGPCSLVTQPMPVCFAEDAPFSGLANRGDGSLLFQIDLNKLGEFISSDEQGSRSGRRGANGVRATSSDLRRVSQKIIVFEAHEKLTLPVHAAKQIVTVPRSQVKVVNEKCFITLDGLSIPLVWVEEILYKMPRPERPEHTIMVYELEGKTFGLPLGDFKGIHRMPAEFDTTLKSPGVMGATVFDGDTHLMVDMNGLTAMAYPGSVSIRSDATGIKKVMIAEDDAFFRGQIVSYLEASGYSVVEFEDGLAAKEALEDREFSVTIDAIVSDIEMPRLDGIALLRYIKSVEYLKQIPVVMLSAITSRDVIQRVMKAGAVGYVTKMQNSQVVDELRKLSAMGSGEATRPTSEYAINEQSVSAGRVDRIVTFKIGDCFFALRMDRIKEVSKLSQTAEVSGFPDWINRVTAFRGKFIPVVNLGKLFGVGGLGTLSGGASREQQIIVENAGYTVCLEVESLGEVLVLSRLSAGEGLSSITADTQKVTQYVDSVHKNKDQVICLIDAKKIVETCQKVDVSNTLQSIKSVNSVNQVA